MLEQLFSTRRLGRQVILAMKKNDVELASDAYNSCMVSVVWNQKWIHGFGYVLIFL